MTIHYEGVLSGEGAYGPLVETVEAFALSRGWPCRRFQQAEVHLLRHTDEASVDYLGPTRGVQVEPHEWAEPLRFEFDDDRFVQDFCKTQFAGVEVHIEVVDLLRALTPFFERFEVFDEGEFWETSDVGVLTSHIERIDQILAEMKRDAPTSQGPVRLESGRITDLWEGRRPAPAPMSGLRKLLGFWRR